MACIGLVREAVLKCGHGTTPKDFGMKTTVEDCFELDMVYLKQEGYLRDSSVGKMSWKDLCSEREALVRSSLREASISVLLEGLKTDYEINSLGCTYGGRKWYFSCHVCGRRCRKLYLPPEEGFFACRQCHNLTYLLQTIHRSSFYSEARAIKRIQRKKAFTVH